MLKKVRLPLLLPMCLLIITLFFSRTTGLAAREFGAARVFAYQVQPGDEYPSYLPVVANASILSDDLRKTDLEKGPTLVTTGNSTSMKIVWQWHDNVSFRVDWGPTTAYGSSSVVVNPYDATNHLYGYTISGLEAGTKYYYRVVVSDQYAGSSFFTAPTSTADSLKFVSYGDTRTYPATHDAVAGWILELYQNDPGYQSVIPFVGDAVSDGNSESAWASQFFDPQYTNLRTELASVALLPVMGNHEKSGELYMRYLPQPFVDGRYWSVDYGPAHFVMLDQYTDYDADSAQFQWLESDLAATSKKWIIVVLHEPGWTAGGGHSNNSTVQQDLQPLFEQHKVAMVLGGHNHYYARAVVNDIQHLTVGTGGAPIYEPDSSQPNIVAAYAGYGYSKFSISGGTLTGWFVDIDGAIRDTFTITR